MCGLGPWLARGSVGRLAPGRTDHPARRHGAMIGVRVRRPPGRFIDPVKVAAMGSGRL